MYRRGVTSMNELVTTSNNSNIEIKTIELETGEKKYEIRKQITDDFTVETKRETNLRVNVINFLNN